MPPRSSPSSEIPRHHQASKEVRVLKRLFVSCPVVVVLTVALLGGPAAGGVVINEIMPDPASDWSPTDGDDVYGSLNDEWVEIFNAGGESVDITGWRLRDAVSDSSWRFGFEGVLPPGAFVVVYGNEAYQWEGANGYSKNGLSLNNTGDTVTLVDADLTIVDQICYDSDNVGDDRAYGRVPDGSATWESIDGLNPANPPGCGFDPSPGMPNVVSPVLPSTWGRIKALLQ
jgi:micrococcal nuclease